MSEAVERPDVVMPECDDCGKNDMVVECGPEIFGSSFWCNRCKCGWVQEV